MLNRRFVFTMLPLAFLMGCATAKKDRSQPRTPAQTPARPGPPECVRAVQGILRQMEGVAEGPKAGLLSPEPWDEVDRARFEPFLNTQVTGYTALFYLKDEKGGTASRHEYSVDYTRDEKTKRCLIYKIELHDMSRE